MKNTAVNDKSMENISFSLIKSDRSNRSNIKNKRSFNNRHEGSDYDDGDEDYEKVEQIRQFNTFESNKTERSELKEYVIPLISENNWRIAKSLPTPQELEKETNEEKTDSDKKVDLINSEKSAQDSVTSQAAKEIIKETGKSSKQGPSTTNIEIPLLLQNPTPVEYEGDNKLDVSLRPDGPSDSDYSKIPIEHYGLAMLRGMGWKPGQGVGKNNKKVDPVQAVVRPKGLGLGADRSQLVTENAPSHAEDSSHSHEMKKGAYCIVTTGDSSGRYGIIEGVDEENSRVVVKMSVTGNTVTLSQFKIKLVTKREFERYSKYLNKSKADDYSSRHSKKHKRRRSDSCSRDNEADYSQSSEVDERLRSQSSSESHSCSKPHKKSHRSSQYHKESSKRPMWLRNNLNVRIIDSKFMNGRYFKTKVKIEDVISSDSCICRTEDGKYLEGVKQKMLETVIPKSHNSYVMVLSGENKNQVAQILEKDKKKSSVLLQLVSDSGDPFVLGYDDVCEYLGDFKEDYDL